MAIGIGLIAIVASNWANIPASAKLIADGLLGTALAASIYRFFHSEGWVRDTLILVFYFFALASMGLIGQIYQTGTPLHEALLFWSVITAPIMLFTRSHFAASAWLLGLLGTYAANAVNFLDNFNRDDTIDFVLVLVFVVPVVLIALGLPQPLRKRAPSVALTFEHAGLALIGLIGVFSQLWWYAIPDEKLAS